MNKPNKATVKAMKENLKNQPRFKTVKALIMDLNKKLTAKSPQKPSRRSKRRFWRVLEKGELLKKGDQLWNTGMTLNWRKKIRKLQLEVKELKVERATIWNDRAKIERQRIRLQDENESLNKAMEGIGSERVIRGHEPHYIDLMYRLDVEMMKQLKDPNSFLKQIFERNMERLKRSLGGYL